MKHPLVAAGSLNRMVQAAEAAWHRKDFLESIETLERASRLAPSNAGILLQLGRYHGLRYDYTAAERCFKQALRVAPRKTEMLTIIADHCHNFRSQDLAERYLRRTLEQPDVTPLACLKLAELYERLRRLPEAAQLVDRALTLNPVFPAALVVRARLERQAGRLESAERLLRSFITKPIPYMMTRVLAWYELGNILDRQEKFNDAMESFLEAKSLLRAEAARNFGRLKILYDDLKLMESNISAEILRHWFDNGAALVPPRRLALLCGYARSGTTLLEQVLDAHPDIVSADETEIFNDDALPPLKRDLPSNTPVLTVLEAADIPVLQQARSGYFRSMEYSIGSPIAGRLLLDKNPILTAHIPAYVRIFPETKFLIALRDPRDVVLSRFMLPQPLVPDTTPFLSLKGTIEDYTIIMGIWRTLKPLTPCPCLEVRYEDMVDNLESVARRTLGFLGAPWEARVLEFDEHARKKIVLSPTYADVTQPVYKRACGRWRNYQKYLEPHLAELEPFVKAFGYD
jgi:tetratricopeptide (TPR) repeat protein